MGADTYAKVCKDDIQFTQGTLHDNDVLKT